MTERTMCCRPTSEARYN